MGGGASGAGFSAKRTIVLPLLLILLYNYLQLAISSNSVIKKKDESTNIQVLRRNIEVEERNALWNLLSSTKQKTEVNWTLSALTRTWSGVGCDENTGRVTNLSLPGKSFIGPIPENTIGLLTHLTRLSLRSNMFSGNIPSDFKNLEYLQILNLGNNNFSGKFPPEITQLKNLKVIDISGNKFSGDISKLDFSNLAKLQTLDLSNNRFSGEFLPNITQLKRLKIIDISRNRFSGEIPCGLQYLPALNALRLEHNNFTGKLPGLHIDKSVNFSVADNNIEGAVPNTLSHLAEEAFVGNSRLCDPPLSLCDITNRSYISLRSYCPSEPSLPNPNIATFAMSGGGALFLLLFLIILLCPVRRKQQQRGAPITTATQSMSSTHEQKSELVIFPDNNRPAWAKGLDVAGVMSWGSVVLGNSTSTGSTTYKVELELTDKVVVVKKLLDPDAVVSDKQDFTNKMDFLGKIESHPNVMPLRGYCIYKELAYLLIYDFFPAGSLYHRLHETELLLKWETRKRIALGAAKGLAHLHTVVKLVHGNIKSSNIILLLDHNNNNNPAVTIDDVYSSCVADYGLTPTPPTSYYYYDVPAAAAATTTIMAASFESDVYAFGVLLLELLTGKSPAARHVKNLTLPEWVMGLLMSGGGGGEAGGATTSSSHEIWDSKMDIIHDQEMKMKMKMQVESESGMVCLLQIAKQCTHQLANERPKMDKVARMIENLIPVNSRDEIQSEGRRPEPVDQDVMSHEIFEDSSSFSYLGTPPPPPSSA